MHHHIFIRFQRIAGFHLPSMLIALLALVTTAPFTMAAKPSASSTQYRYSIVREYLHNSSLFTQGLEFYQGKLYESAGRYQHSSLSVRTLQSASILQQHRLPKHYFAEGLSLLKGKLYQLTWQAGKAFVYDVEQLQHRQTFNYRGQGWGLCNNGLELIMSNGTSQLQFIDPQTFNTTRTINVQENGKALRWLNELEWVEGKIYANIWQSNRIVIINPNNGMVEGYLDLSGILPNNERKPNTDVLNGIAYDHHLKRLFITGKYWPKLYQIKLIP